MSTLLQTLKNEWDTPRPEALARSPLYHQLYTLIRNAILDGRLRYQDMLPTEEQLTETFGVSRITAKRAMAELADEKLIERQRGKGSHVIHRYEPQPLSAPLVGMLENYEELASSSTPHVFEVGMVIPPAEVQKELGTRANDPVLKTVRVHTRDHDRPYSHYTSWTPRVATSAIDPEQLRTQSRLKILREYGLVFHRVTQHLGATAADPDIANKLGVDVGAPLLSLVRRSYNPDNDCIDIVFGLYNPELFQYAMELRQ